MRRGFDRTLALVGAQPDDASGLLLLLAGVLLALGIHFGALGPAGRAIEHSGGRLVGWGEDVIPASLLVGGALLVAKRSRWGLLGTLGSAALLALAAAGLADLAGGTPSVSATAARLGGAGGLVGSGVGGGLATVLGVGGAGVLLGAAAFTASCWILGGRVVEVLRASVSGLARALASAATALRDLRREALAGAGLEARRGAALTAPFGPAPGARGARGARGAPGAAEAGPAPAAAGHIPALASLYDGDTEDSDDVLLSVSLSGQSGRTDPEVGPEQPPELPNVSQGATERGSPRPGGMLDPAVIGAKPEQLTLPVPLPNANWRLPALRLLKRSKDQAHDRVEIEARGRVLERALAAHGVETHLVGFTVGPTVTRFELELGAGVKVARVTNLAKDIAYAMASADVRILAPIPGRSAIGVEVPNQNRQLVTLGDVLSTGDARRATHPLEVALGRDIAGRAVMVNLAEMPHLLIAGATGAGKSSCINSVITSVLMRATPDEVRLILVDPKRVELGQYNGLPHLLTQVVVNPKRAANALSWAVAEMERRYDLLAEVGMRDITGYNAAVDRGDLLAPEPPAEPGSRSAEPGPGPAEPGSGPAEPGPELLGGDLVPLASPEGILASPAWPPGAAPSPSPAVAAMVDESRARTSKSESVTHARLPFVLIVVDELNDLMMVAARDVEESICRIAQMARAVGIHLVIATQRPSVDVITGVIKANIPSRLAFSVSSLADSRVILDQPGAERLIGRGDLLLLSASSSVPRRLQGPWVGEEEVRAVVGHWRRQSAPCYVEGVEGDGPGSGAGTGGGNEDDDELLATAMELVVRSQLGSTSMLQRKLRVGFARAGRLMDLMERRGVVGPSEGSKARAVLMTAEELDQIDP